LAGAWTLYLNEGQLDWNTNGSASNQVIGGAIDNVADVLAKRTRNSANNMKVASHQVLLTVSNVKSVTEYTKILAYLHDLKMVSQVEVLRMQPSQVVFAIGLIGKPEAFQKTLMVSHKFKPVKGKNSAANNDVNLHYQWTK
jgi:hypothetical protein